MQNLFTKFLDSDFNSPILGASGTFGYGDEFNQFINYSYLGAIVTKGLSLKEWQGNPPPRICETPSGLMNSIGLQNIGVDKFIEKKLPIISKFDTKIIVNIVGRNENQYKEVILKLNEFAEIFAFEVNISCPNVKHGGLAFGTNPKIVESLIGNIRKITKKKIITKLTPNVTSISEIAKAAEFAGSDAISLINTVLACKINLKTQKPYFHNTFAGLSGPAIHPVAVAKVYEVYRNVKIPIIGIGGVTNFEDFLELIYAGASLVQIGSGNLVYPKIINKIANELSKYLLENNINNIEDLVGIANEKILSK